MKSVDGYHPGPHALPRILAGGKSSAVGRATVVGAGDVAVAVVAVAADAGGGSDLA